MATQPSNVEPPRETASVRANILLTPSEHRRWTDAARRQGVSFGEYVRRSLAAAETAPSDAELAELRQLAEALTGGAARMHAAIDSAIAQLDASARASDDEIRARIAADLAIDPAILDFGA
ncbi:hypothetical protein IP88_02280 [alpha proteobacterium AAP81b]|nr:hypothetical protein IP88_02280 [alpha proteobacterium AAP81b]